MTRAALVLADGTVFKGLSIGADGESVGEVVFNTAMTGYQEILTDPSYARQMVTLTYPHIGNVGVNDEDIESRSVFAAGLIIRHLPKRMSNFRAGQSLPDYLKANNVVAISDIDTRKLTRLLRDNGSQSGCLVAGENLDIDSALANARGFAGLAGMDLAKEVTATAPYVWEEGVWALEGGVKAAGPENLNREKLNREKFKVVAYDFGVKHNILRLLVDRGCEVEVVPAQTPAADVLAKKPDGVFLSNGPGDPEPCDYAIKAIGDIVATDMPVFGICLGHQLLALASGARTMKMKTGHHGANHPVQDMDTTQVLITSQNHGFAVDEASAGNNLRITHKSLFDGTVQGIARTDKPAFSFQGHPEASPGPHDVDYLFDRFTQLMTEHSPNRSGA